MGREKGVLGGVWLGGRQKFSWSAQTIVPQPSRRKKKDVKKVSKKGWARRREDFQREKAFSSFQADDFRIRIF